MLEAEGLGWIPLELVVYLHVSDANVTEVLVVGVTEAGEAVLLVG
ncbi:hypothetical protein [Limnohabitans sp. Rim28]|nr:hypothetical protein [Limnohabitans sp. Rim28]